MIRQSVTLAAAFAVSCLPPVWAAALKPSLKPLLPPSFYAGPSFPRSARPFGTLLAKNAYARDLGDKFNKLLRGDTRRPCIALTFDDGPHPVYTLQLLDILRRTHTPATFFLVGEQVAKYPGLAQLEVAEGNEVADHTYDHINLTVIPPELVGYEVQRCNAALQRATGAPVRFFRPPGGEYDGETVREVSRHGFITTLWTNDPGDFSRPPAAVIQKRTLAHLENGGIILLHDGIPETLTALPAIIAEARRRGVQLVTVRRLVRPQ